MSSHEMSADESNMSVNDNASQPLSYEHMSSSSTQSPSSMSAGHSAGHGSTGSVYSGNHSVITNKHKSHSQNKHSKNKNKNKNKQQTQTQTQTQTTQSSTTQETQESQQQSQPFNSNSSVISGSVMNASVNQKFSPLESEVEEQEEQEEQEQEEAE